MIHSSKKVELLKKLLELRDKIGRKEDECITYTLSNRSMFHIMEYMPKTI